MKKEKYLFNHLLRTYFKYQRRLKKLRFFNKNIRRQHILEKHISRLFKKLTLLKASLKLTTAVASIAIGSFAFTNVNAQSFGSPQTSPFGLTDVAAFVVPVFADIDNDGDFDMFAGDYGGNFLYYPNNGTNSAPAFGAAQSNPFGLSNSGVLRVAPAFADMDNDGDLDILAQARYGNFHFYENTGTASAPAFAAKVTNPFGLTDVGVRTSLTLADLDNDGDFDVMTGEYYGSFHYFENTGTVSAPAFAADQVNPFGLATISTYRTAPSFIDIDSDGDYDLMVGEYYGNFFFFENTGTVSAPAFGTMQTNPFGITSLSGIPESMTDVDFADLDNDGDMDMISGGYYGDFYYFENTTVTGTPPSAPTNTTASGNLTICYNTSTQLSVSGVGTIGWYDASSGGNYLGGGSTYTTMALTANTTFYAQDSTAAGPSTSRTAIAVTVNAAIDVSTSVNGTTIMATATGATYQWLDCNNGNAAISSATSQNFTPSANGNYAVEITVGSCSDTSTCVAINTVGIDENKNELISIYPNPSRGQFTIELNEPAQVEIIDAIGKIVFSQQVNSGKQLINLESENGIYFLKITSSEKQRTERIIINK